MNLTPIMSKPGCLTALLLAAGLLSGCGGDTSAPAAPAAAPAPRLLSQTSHANATAVRAFPGKLADYTVVRGASVVSVTEKAGAKAVVTVPTGHQLLFADAAVATSLDDGAAKAYRLYQAAFDRVPDAAGLGFHISTLDGLGLPLERIAQGFVESPEFATRYGQLNDEQFVTRLYNNVLKRAPEAAGLKFYLDLLAAGQVTRAQVLGFFSESPENQQLVAPAIANGIAFTPYVVGGAGQASAADRGPARAFWRAETALDLVLRDQRGTAVPPSGLQCSAVDAAVLTVASDCRSVSGLRLGTHEVIVNGGGVSARLAVKVTPQRVALGMAGVSENFALVSGAAGEVYAWGRNGGRQLGQGASETDSNVPLLVKSSDGNATLGGIVAASAGAHDGMALSEDGLVYGWAGAEDFARPKGAGPLPALIRNPANNGSLSGIVQVATGDKNAVALSDDGRVLTWGYYHGQGVGGDSAYPNQPRLAGGEALTGVVQIAAGWNFGLALHADGKVYGWGWNSAGQAGRGSKTNPEHSAAPVIRASDNAPIDNIVAISAGYNFAMALASDGRVWIWGSNDFHQLGQQVEDGEYHRAVLLKNPAGTGPMENIAMVSAGGVYGLVLDTQGRVYSWGHNNDGELGEGTARNIGWRGLPAAVVGPDGLGQLSGIVSIAAGHDNGYALGQDGTILAWGNGFAGANGTGVVVADDLRVPTPVAGLNRQGKLTLNLAAYPNLLRRGR